MNLSHLANDPYKEMEEHFKPIAEKLQCSVACAADIWYLKRRSRWSQERENELIREHDMKQRIQKLCDYLSQCANPNDPSSFTAPAAQAVLDALINAFGDTLAIPTAGLGHDGEITLLWRNGNKSLEIEILPDHTIEFFGFNRDSEIAWEESLSAEHTIPSNLLKLLSPFVTV